MDPNFLHFGRGRIFIITSVITPRVPAKNQSSLIVHSYLLTYSYHNAKQIKIEHLMCEY